MRFRIAFGFILLILALAGIFIGLPYVVGVLKDSQFLSLSKSLVGNRQFPRDFAPEIKTPEPGEAPAAEPPVNPGDSIYKGKVRISAVYRPFGQQQIDLRAPYFGDGTVNVTGWKIVNSKNAETVIGRGNSLPQFGFVSDITLGAGDTASIFTGLSPLAGDFRVNECFGWLNNLYNFNPTISTSCPRFDLADLYGLDGQCQELILNSSYCRAPADDVLNNYSANCRAWVSQNMNYNTCVIKNRNNGNFYKEWRIYTGNGNLIADPLHDRIELRDSAGLLVDKYEY